MSSVEDGQDINRAYQNLVKWIRRYHGCYDYCAVRTSEGNGVYHILYFGEFLPYEEVKEKWILFQGAWNISVSDVGDIRSAGKLVNYILGNYIKNQPVVRISASAGWVYRGFMKDYLYLKKKYGEGRRKSFYRMWYQMMKNHQRRKNMKQAELIPLWDNGEN